METWSNKETMFFNPETGKLSPVKTDDKAVAVSMAADGFFFYFTIMKGSAGLYHLDQLSQLVQSVVANK